jgi:nucleoside-diphosphate-sugar epimerase
MQRPMGEPSRPTLLCFGLGYSARRFVALYGDNLGNVFGTVRSIERADALNMASDGRLQPLVFDGHRATSALTDAMAQVDRVLVSIPPQAGRDSVLTAMEDAVARAPRLRTIVYLSTVGVYGDHGGGWVDETTPPRANVARSRSRLDAERAWQALGMRCGTAVAILRLAGIYGPQRSVLDQLARGDARIIVKPNQMFNRIHVDDIAQAIAAAFARHANGIFNVADDEPAPPGDPIMFAARLLDCEVPPKIPFAEAESSMSAMALSFWGECRRVRNDKFKRELGVALLYPTYREGLRAILDLSAGSGPSGSGHARPT